MSRLWRISNYADLSGFGGLKFSGRWHTCGRPAVYAAEHPAGAMTEMLVHFTRENLPDAFQLIEIDLDDTAAMETAAPPPGWRDSEAATRAIGDAWLAQKRSLALRVPSALVPQAWNVLLNPAHPEAAKMRVAALHPVPVDPRFR